jgi:hypothetical protein
VDSYFRSGPAAEFTKVFAACGGMAEECPTVNSHLSSSPAAEFTGLFVTGGSVAEY